MSNVQHAKDIYAAFGKGDIPTVLAAFHPEIEWRQAEGNPYHLDGSAWIGPQAVLDNLFMKIGAEWDGFTITIRTIHDAGEYVIVEGRYTGTYRHKDLARATVTWDGRQLVLKDEAEQPLSRARGTTFRTPDGEEVTFVFKPGEEKARYLHRDLLTSVRTGG